MGYHRLLQGVYERVPMVEGLDDWERRRHDYLRRARAVLAAYPDKGVVLFGPTAFEALGVGLPESIQDWDNCHILVPPGISRPIRHGVVSHQSTHPLKVWAHINDLPVLHPVDHWIQLRTASDTELIEVGDGLLRRRHPLLRIDQIEIRLAQLSGRSGVKRVRKVLRWVRANTDSLYETRTRLVLVRAGLPEPMVNLPVYCVSAGVTFHLDMGYSEEKIGIEYDGAVHVGDRTQMEIDAGRRRLLQDEGWMIITVTAAQLRHPNQIVHSVEQALIIRRAIAKNSW